MPVPVFYLVFVQKIKVLQTQQNFLWIFSGPEDNRGSEEVPKRGPEVGNTHHGAPEGPGAPWWVMPTSVASRTASSPYKFPNIPKPLVVTLDEKFRCRKPLYPWETNRDSFSVICRRGNHHRRRSSSSRRSPWRGGSSSPSGLRVCTSSYVFNLSLSRVLDGTILMYRGLC